MAKAEIVRDAQGVFYGIRFKCPGCVYMDGSPMWETLPVNWLPPGETQESPHQQGKAHWGFDGNFDAPTFTPSINTWWGGEKYKNEDGTEYTPVPLHRCHSFIRAGRIQYLGDCTHALVNQTVDLPVLQSIATD